MMNEQKYVTVRIAVSMCDDGSWRAYGSDTPNSYEVDDILLHEPQTGDVMHWVEAQIPLPKPQPINTIKGKVVQ